MYVQYTTTSMYVCMYATTVYMYVCMYACMCSVRICTLLEKPMNFLQINMAAVLLE